MIKQLELLDLPVFLNILQQSLLTGTKMEVRYRLFENRKSFLKNYMLKNEKAIAALQIFESTAYLASPLEISPDVLEEAAEFAVFMGASRLELTTKNGIAKLTKFCKENNWIFELNTVFECTRQATDLGQQKATDQTAPPRLSTVYKENSSTSNQTHAQVPNLQVFQNPQSLKSTYLLLSECFPDFEKAVLYDDFLAELMPKINNQKAAVFTATLGCQPVATASLSFLGKHFAVVGAVGVSPQFRGAGLGTNILNTVLQSTFAAQKHCFAAAASTQSKNFYNHLKFPQHGCQLTVALANNRTEKI